MSKKVRNKKLEKVSNSVDSKSFTSSFEVASFTGNLQGCIFLRIPPPPHPTAVLFKGDVRFDHISVLGLNFSSNFADFLHEGLNFVAID